MKLKVLTALVVLIPMFAWAKPKTATAHMRPQLYRDRAPQARVRDSHSREARVRPAKSQSAPQAREDF